LGEHVFWRHVTHSCNYPAPPRNLLHPPCSRSSRSRPDARGAHQRSAPRGRADSDAEHTSLIRRSKRTFFLSRRAAANLPSDRCHGYCTPVLFRPLLALRGGKQRFGEKRRHGDDQDTGSRTEETKLLPC
jgi:hypothetical protein